MIKVQIVMVTDMRMFEPTLTAMMSAVEHCSRPVTVHFLGHDISDKARCLLDAAVRCLPKTDLRFYDLSEALAEGWDDFKYDGRHSAATRANLFIPKLVDSGRVLYLDSDTITHTDVSPLFYMDMKGCHVAAARDYGYLASWSEFRPKGIRAAGAKALCRPVSWLRKRTGAVPALATPLKNLENLLNYYRTGKNPPYSWERRVIYPYPIYDYVNTGVVLFDVDSIKGEPGLLDTLTRYLPADQANETCHFIEVMKGHTLILDPCWNALVGIYHRYSRIHEATVLDGSRYVHEDARIVHHVGIEKPWHDFGLDELQADPQKMRERMYSDLQLEAYGHPIKDVFHELKDQECVDEYCALTKIWRDSHDRYMGMLKKEVSEAQTHIRKRSAGCGMKSAEKDKEMGCP